MKKTMNSLLAFLILACCFLPAKSLFAEEVLPDPPRLVIYYHEYAKRAVVSSADHVNEDVDHINQEALGPESELYINKRTQICLELLTADFVPENVEIHIFRHIVKGTRKELEEVTDVCLKNEKWQQAAEEAWYQNIILEDEGTYHILLSYRDSYGQEIQNGMDSQDACFEDGTYYSPYITIDETTPLMEEIESDLTKLGQKEGIDLYGDFPTFEIVICEENFNASCFYLKKGGEDMSISDWVSYYEDGRRKNKALLTVGRTGLHKLRWGIRDGSGKHQIEGSMNFVVDMVKPELTMNPYTQDVFRSPYEENTLFSGKPIRYSLEARDQEGSIAGISYSYYTKDGRVKEAWVENTAFSQTFSVDITLDQGDFCGWICARAVDDVNLASDERRSKNLLWESESKHTTSSSVKMTLSEPDNEEESKHILYYKNPPRMIIQGKDSVSGVKAIYIQGANGKKSFEQTIDFTKRDSLQYDFREEIELSLKEEISSGKDFLELKAFFEDNAGYRTCCDKMAEKIILDQVKPEISIEYDKSQGTSYYNERRTAVVRVEDWNFTESGLEWRIQGDSKGYEIGRWQGKGKDHWCKITFSKDGTYKLGIKVRDKAGNVSEYVDVNSFVIDQTRPRIHLWMSKEGCKNDIYYRKNKKIYVFVNDENVGTNNIFLYNAASKPRSYEKLTQTRNPREISAMQKNADWQKISGKQIRERIYAGWKVYEMNCSADGQYNMKAFCLDKAGNKSDEASLETFVMDQTPPSVSLDNLVEGITYVDQFSAQVEIQDQNLSHKDCQVEVDYEDGSKSATFSSRLYRIEGQGSTRYLWKNIPGKKENDNKYTLKIQAMDLAGNMADELTEVNFCIDRYGARYSASPASLEYIKKYYHRQEEDIEVTVYSLHPVQETITVEKGDNSILTLKPEEKDYTKESRILTNEDKVDNHVLQEKHAGWYETIYRISKKLFAEEGEYCIFFNHQETCPGLREDNHIESDSMLWMDSIQFAIDKTSPSVTIGNLDQEVYASGNHKYVITALDNQRLKRVRVRVRKNGKEYVKEYGEKDFNEMNSITEELVSAKGYQYLGYEAWDYAGNKVDSLSQGGEKKVLIMENNLERSFYLYPVRWCLACLACGILLFFVFVLTGRLFFGILENKRG